MLGVVVFALALCVVAAVPDVDAQGLTFNDLDFRANLIAGIAVINRAQIETNITHYAIYFSGSTTAPAEPLVQPLGYEYPAVVDNIVLPDEKNPAHPAGFINVLVPPTLTPDNAVSLIVVSLNQDGRKSNTSTILALLDVTQAPSKFCQPNTQLTTPSGAFEDGSGSVKYTDASQGNYTCVWTISNSNVDKFLFRVTALDLDSTHLDKLCVYDGAGARNLSTTLHCYDQQSGPDTSANIVSTKNTIQVEFSVNAGGGDGFRAVFYGLTDKVVQNTQDGSVFEVQYDQDIPVNCHCTDVSCQDQASNCIVDQGNGKGFATCQNLGTCRD